MDVPPETDKRWKEIITAKVKPQFDFLAVKIFLVRATIEVNRDSSSSRVEELAVELRELFAKNAQLTSVQKDIGKIFG
ncbi:MAG: hypothetical protein HY791_08995 [Deltaproteobacteria bacterium]|nr:hypothetical protein [Deltaproteobacteria bacterium]